MIHAAIVEDEQKAADKLISYLRRLEEMGDEQFDISHFLSPDAFFFSFQSQYDLIFMDIQLPGMNGMKAAEKLREWIRRSWCASIWRTRSDRRRRPQKRHTPLPPVHP